MFIKKFKSVVGRKCFSFSVCAEVWTKEQNHPATELNHQIWKVVFKKKIVGHGSIPTTLALNWLRQGYSEFSASLGYILSPRTEWDLDSKLKTGTDTQTENRKVETCLREHSHNRKCYWDQIHKDLSTNWFNLSRWTSAHSPYHVVLPSSSENLSGKTWGENQNYLCSLDHLTVSFSKPPSVTQKRWIIKTVTFFFFY